VGGRTAKNTVYALWVGGNDLALGDSLVGITSREQLRCCSSTVNGSSLRSTPLVDGGLSYSAPKQSNMHPSISIKTSFLLARKLAGLTFPHLEYQTGQLG
jgi:hypothetical protein